MRKFYRVIVLLLIMIFLTTYNPGDLNIFPDKKNHFFKIKEIQIKNNNLINKNEIIKKLTKIYEKNILFLTRSEIEMPLESIEFLERIEVKKKYPSTIIVYVYEAKPVAILFKENSKYLLDSSSKLIPFKENMSFSNLPTIFGEDAENNFLNFLDKLNNNNFPIHRVKNYYFFQIGRWDLQLLNKQLIKFPANKISKAIQQSIKLLTREDFKSYKIIDLRIHGKIVVE